VKVCVFATLFKCPKWSNGKSKIIEGAKIKKIDQKTDENW
jgi:hypothetical protein